MASGNKRTNVNFLHGRTLSDRPDTVALADRVLDDFKANGKSNGPNHPPLVYTLSNTDELKRFVDIAGLFDWNKLYIYAGRNDRCSVSIPADHAVPLQPGQTIKDWLEEFDTKDRAIADVVVVMTRASAKAFPNWAPDYITSICPVPRSVYSW